jgi:cyclic-di-AMP phosphodiesterase PgpH
VVVVSFVLLLVALGSPFIFGHKLQPGEIADRDYIARQKSYVVDLGKTREAQDLARESALPVFRKSEKMNTTITQLVKLKLDAVGNAINQPAGQPPTPDITVRQLAAAIGKDQYPAWRAAIEKAMPQFLNSQYLLSGDHQNEWQSCFYEFLPERFSDALRKQTSSYICTSMQPNVLVDAQATKQRKKETVAHIAPITKAVEAGTVIIRKGEQLTPEDVDVLDQMGIGHTRDLQTLLGVTTCLLTAFMLFGMFLYTIEPQYFFAPSALALMATVCIAASAIAAAVGHEFPQFVPVPAMALVLSVIFGRRVSTILTMLIIIFLFVSNLVDAAHLVALAAASGIALGANITKRTGLMLTGVLIGVVQAIAYFVAAMFGDMPGSALGLGVGMGVGMGKELAENLLGGLSSSIVAIGSLPFLEIIFGILTPFRIAELSEPDQPLLRQLEENAPGTYQHSLAVANLAEAGAKSIGADINLVRAGAMYHDIGKMVTPRYFIENQLGDKNPHDEIAPEESRAKVLAHVTNGLVLARKYGLPKQIQDFIPEHQGTTIMAYFFHKACLRDGVQNVVELDYRYPGPKPQTKETAIVMLADVSEAVTHSMHDPSQKEVEAAIGNVFKARWDDGQFADSDLTPEELDKVKNAFVRVWRTLHHERLKYPATTTGRMPVPPQYPPAPEQVGTPDC